MHVTVPKIASFLFTRLCIYTTHTLQLQRSLFTERIVVTMVLKQSRTASWHLMTCKRFLRAFKKAREARNLFCHSHQITVFTVKRRRHHHPEICSSASGICRLIPNISEQGHSFLLKEVRAPVE